MTRVEYLNEQLDFIYLTEDIKTAIKKLDVEKLKAAAKSKSKFKILQALKDIPQVSFDEIKNASMKKDENFKKYYKQASNIIKSDETKSKKILALSYSSIKSVAEQHPKVRERLNKIAKRLWNIIASKTSKEVGGIIIAIILISALATIMTMVLVPILVSPLSLAMPAIKALIPVFAIAWCIMMVTKAHVDVRRQ